MQTKELISEGDSLVVRSYDDKCSYILQVNGEKKINKSRVSLKEIVGQPYGAVFELNNRKFKRISEIEQAEVELYDPEDYGEVPAQESTNPDGRKRGDNSKFVDTNTAQKLSAEEIARLKESGTSAQEIIKTLIQNSDTFAEKTDYAQAKWIKKKENKYRRRYKVLRSTPMSICEASYDKNREKICSMRFESLAQVLSQSGVHSGTRVLVMDSLTGLLVGSLAYRMRGRGLILALYGGQQPHLEMVNHFNLSTEDMAIIQPIPSTELGPAAQDVCRDGFYYDAIPGTEATGADGTTGAAGADAGPDADAGACCADGSADAVTGTVEAETVADSAAGHKRSAATALDTPTEGTAVSSTADASAEDNSLPAQSAKVNAPFGNDSRRIPNSSGAVKGPNKTGRTDAEKLQVRAYLRQGVDRLIIASKYRPLPILKQALYLLQPSSPFVVFHEFLEPLVDCYLYLQANALALRLVLSDTWMREFQTLPGRVRPDMFMSTSGGFLLSGIYVGQVPCAYVYGAGTTGNSASSDVVMDST